MEGVTFGDSFHAHPSTANESEPADGFLGIMRAGGIKTAARRKQRRNDETIRFDKENKQIFHESANRLNEIDNRVKIVKILFY